MQVNKSLGCQAFPATFIPDPLIMKLSPVPRGDQIIYHPNQNTFRAKGGTDQRIQNWDVKVMWDLQPSCPLSYKGEYLVYKDF